MTTTLTLIKNAPLTIVFPCSDMQRFGHCSCHCCGYCHHLKTECICNGHGVVNDQHECKYCLRLITGDDEEHGCWEDNRIY